MATNEAYGGLRRYVRTFRCELSYVLMNLKPLEDMQFSEKEGKTKHCYSSQADKLQKHGPIVLALPWGGNDARDVVNHFFPQLRTHS